MMLESTIIEKREKNDSASLENQIKSKLTTLENADYSHLFKSGEAAIMALLNTLKVGDEIIFSKELNSRLFNLLSSIYLKFGISMQREDLSDLANLSNIISDKTRLIWIESPSLPNRRICDIKNISTIAHDFDAKVVVDNSHNTPLGQKPLDLGADYSIYTDTSLLLGDNKAGVLCYNDSDYSELIKEQEKLLGYDNHLNLHRIKDHLLNLSESINIKSENALKISIALSKSAKIGRVFYPGLETHVNHTLACNQQQNFGSHLSFYLTDDTIEKAEKFVRLTREFEKAETPQLLKTTIFHPARTILKDIPAFSRRRSGIRDSLIVINVGKENENFLVDYLLYILDEI